MVRVSIVPPMSMVIMIMVAIVAAGGRIERAKADRQHPKPDRRAGSGIGILLGGHLRLPYPHSCYLLRQEVPGCLVTGMAGCLRCNIVLLREAQILHRRWR